MKQFIVDGGSDAKQTGVESNRQTVAIIDSANTADFENILKNTLPGKVGQDCIKSSRMTKFMDKKLV